MIESIYSAFLESGRQICTDSRNIIPGSIFFALKGENFDGNNYAHKAIKDGAAYAVIDNSKYKSENTFLVKDSLECLQELANLYRLRNNFKVIALTGTNGKTTTKELINATLNQKYQCHATKGNLNNHIGVPLTILSAPVSSDLLVIEMGANHIGEIAQLCNIAQPDFGLITNIGKAHLEGFGGYNGVIRAKSELYNNLIENNKTIIVNSEDELLLSLLNNYKKVEKYGSKESGLYATDISFKNGLSFSISLTNNVKKIKTQLFGNYNLTNVLAAIKIGLVFKVPINKIISAISEYQPENNRSQYLNTKHNQVILDSYNANPSSMKAALESFNEIKHNNKVLILGSMKELGSESNKEHKALVELTRKQNIVKVFFVGHEFISIKKETEKYFENTDDLVKYLKDNKLKNYMILVKGSRANRLEQITDYL